MSVNQHNASSLTTGIEPEGANPWALAASFLAARLRQYAWLICAAILAGAVLGAVAREVVPPNFKATVQLLIDPRGFRLFSNDLSSGQFDANAAINFVESQMGVIRSARVLLRVARDEQMLRAGPPATVAVSPAREFDETRALALLQKALSVQRSERSFIIDVTMAADTPDRAATLANSVVRAYIAEDASDRDAAAKRLTTELSSRLEGMRATLRAAEAKVEAFRVEHGLVGVRDRPIIERRLSEATTALGIAENRQAQAQTRLKQLDAAPAMLSAIGALGTDPESRQLQLLLDSQAAARAEVDRLSGELGASHPALISARDRMRETGKRVIEALQGVRRAVRGQFAQARTETETLTRSVTALSTDLAKVRQAETQLRTLESDVDGNRKILDSFETRSREAREFGKIDGTNLRIVSPARAPNVQGALRGLVVWGLAGGLMAGALAAGAAGFSGAFGRNSTPQSALDAKSHAAIPRASPLDEVDLHPDSGFSMAVKQLFFSCRAAPQLRSHRKTANSVLVTSLQPGCGKTCVAVNLARVAAAAGLRTLLIDANPDNPSLAALIPDEATAIWINLAGTAGQLFHLPILGQMLSVMPLMAANTSSQSRPKGGSARTTIDGIAGNFDFVVFDGPVSGEDAPAVADAVRHIVLVATSDETAAVRAGDVPDWLAALDIKFIGAVAPTAQQKRAA